MKIHYQHPKFILRDFCEQDIQGIYLLDTDPLVHQYLGNKPISSLEQAENTVKNVMQQYLDFGIGRWAIIEPNTQEFIGWCGIKYVTDTVNQLRNFYDIGYRIRREFWRKGYALETAKICLNHGFETLNLSQIIGTAHTENTGSNAILKAIGLDYKNTFTYDTFQCHWYELNKVDYLFRQQIQ